MAAKPTYRPDISIGGIERIGDGRVPQSMRLDLEPGGLADAFTNPVPPIPTSATDKGGPVQGHKERPRFFSPHFPPRQEGFFGRLRERQRLSLALSLPQHLDPSLFEIDMFHIETHRFIPSQAQVIEEP